MATKKPEVEVEVESTVRPDTEYRKVLIEHSNPEVETPAGFVGGNDIIENGKNVVKHFRFQVGKEVELPVTFIKQLKDRKQIVSVGSSTTKDKSIRIYNITEV